MWMNRLSGPILMFSVKARTAGAVGEIVERRGDAERREDVRRNLEAELAPEGPGRNGRSTSPR